MDYPAAAHRLQLGVPATVEHASESKPHAAVHAQLVAETTQNFITLMDALKLKMRAKDQLHPLLSDLLSAYTKVGAADGEAREKLLAWYVLVCADAGSLHSTSSVRAKRWTRRRRARCSLISSTRIRRGSRVCRVHSYETGKSLSLIHI